MGLSSTTTASEAVLFCVFDMRRGQQEGQEIDKILFFFPPECVYSKQLSVIGLSEGLITFTRIFSPGAGCEVIEAEKHTHVFYQAEPDIWFVMVVEKTSEAIWRSSGLQGVLKEVHNLFLMFNGPVRTLLDKQPSGVLARNHLHFFISDYLNDFLVGKKYKMPSFRDCLKERGTIQMLTLGRELAIEVQSLVTALESSCAGATCKSLILFQDLFVSSSLSPDDMTNLFTYAVMRLTPHALSSIMSSRSYLGKGSSSSNVLAASMMANTGCILEANQYLLQAASPARNGHGCPVRRPLQRDIWQKGKDGYLFSETRHEEVDSLTSVAPTLWLKNSEEHMLPCIYQHKNLTIIVLIPAASLVSGDQELIVIKRRILENAYQKLVTIEDKLSRSWGGENMYHVSGYRYLMLNNYNRLSRCSPPGKVTTLTKESLLALNKLREEVDLEKSRARSVSVDHEKDLEICIRAKNNAWVIARVVGGKELFMALEKANETLVYASEAVEKFTSRFCDGAFSLD